jgi:uncharacterized protein YfaT (DUF1175 family)
MDIRSRVKAAALGVIGCLCLGWGFSIHFGNKAQASRWPASGIREARAKAAYPAASDATALSAAAWRDRLGDGTPDFLRLDTEADRQAFRDWFVAIAEFESLRPPADVPPEIVDCAALLRYSYRNALRVHDRTWTFETGIEPEPFPDVIAKYRYPPRLLLASLFRTRPGPLSPDDANSGAFSQFADAKTLAAFNTFFVSRDVRAAQPGDILFYRQPEQSEPFHSMIYVGPSRWLPDPPGDWTSAVIVYHNGETGSVGKGMRRVVIAQLLDDPSPRWKPVPGNANFLGVYRWNILRGED